MAVKVILREEPEAVGAGPAHVVPLRVERAGVRDVVFAGPGSGDRAAVRGYEFEGQETFYKVPFLRVDEAAKVAAGLAERDEGYGIENADYRALDLCGEEGEGGGGHN